MEQLGDKIWGRVREQALIQDMGQICMKVYWQGVMQVLNPAVEQVQMQVQWQIVDQIEEILDAAVKR
jgi:hypothetical protein